MAADYFLWAGVEAMKELMLVFGNGGAAFSSKIKYCWWQAYLLILPAYDWFARKFVQYIRGGVVHAVVHTRMSVCVLWSCICDVCVRVGERNSGHCCYLSGHQFGCCHFLVLSTYMLHVLSFQQKCCMYFPFNKRAAFAFLLTGLLIYNNNFLCMLVLKIK